LVLAYFGNFDSAEYTKIFLGVSTTGSVAEKFQFVHLNDKECAAKHGASSTPSVVLLRQFDNSPVVYSGNLEVQPIVDWATSLSVPTLIEFSEDYIDPIFQ